MSWYGVPLATVVINGDVLRPSAAEVVHKAVEEFADRLQGRYDEETVKRYMKRIEEIRTAWNKI